MKRRVTFCVLTLLIASALAREALADGSGPWGGLGWDTSTEGRKSASKHYDDPVVPYSGGGPSDLPMVIDILVVGAIVSIVAFAVFMLRGEKSPEEALRERAKSSQTKRSIQP